MNIRITALVVAINLCTFAQARNVVLLISDNQNQGDCGCYGNQVLKTPNLDRLAAQGVRFTEAFATTASCGPSRAVIYSGLQTHSNGQYGHGHGIHTYRLSPKVDTVFKCLVDSGYRTTLLGKQHTTHPDSYPFTFQKNDSGRDVVGLANMAKEFIEDAGDTPFFLAIGYSDPHPTSRDRPGWGVVGNQGKVPLLNYSPDDVIVPSYLPDRPEVREGLAGYYQQISYLDHGIGLILDVLKQTKKEDDTLVIFTSDHGSSEPGAMCNHYEPGVRVPMIVRAGSEKNGGQTSSAMVTLADITPTVLQWTGVKGPKYPLHGRSFLPAVDDPNVSGWDQVMLSHVCHEVTQYYPMRTIRDRRYKMIWNVDWRSEYPLPIDTLQRATWTETIRRGDPAIGKRSVQKFLFRDQVELYDLQSDPDEVINLAEDPKHQEIRTRLSNDLKKWLTETKDPWLVRHQLPMPGQPDDASSKQAKLVSTDYQSIFNGKDLDGWQLHRGDRGGYEVRDGVLVCPEGHYGFLFTDETYDDFSFQFEFRLSKSANNGIAIRCPLVEAKPAYEGIEVQILDNENAKAGLKPTQYHGSLYDIAAAKRGALKPAGQWNRQHIWCKDKRVVVTVNDVLILDADLSKVDGDVLAKHPGISRTDGHIGLLGHGDEVAFRNMRVKRL